MNLVVLAAQLAVELTSVEWWLEHSCMMQQRLEQSRSNVLEEARFHLCQILLHGLSLFQEESDILSIFHYLGQKPQPKP